MLKSFLISILFLLCLAVPGSLVAQTTNSNPKPPPAPTQQTITYQEAVVVWTEVQPIFYPMLRMTVDDLLEAYFRNGEGEILKVATQTYRAEMRGCTIVIFIDESF